MEPPPRSKRPGCAEAAAASAAARNIPGDIGRKQQAAKGARPPPSPSKDAKMVPPPPQAPSRGDRMHAAAVLNAMGAAMSRDPSPVRPMPDLMGAACLAYALSALRGKGVESAYFHSSVQWCLMEGGLSAYCSVHGSVHGVTVSWTCM